MTYLVTTYFGKKKKKKHTSMPGTSLEVVQKMLENYFKISKC